MVWSRHTLRGLGLGIDEVEHGVDVIEAFGAVVLERRDILQAPKAELVDVDVERLTCLRVGRLLPRRPGCVEVIERLLDARLRR